MSRVLFPTIAVGALLLSAVAVPALLKAQCIAAVTDRSFAVDFVFAAARRDLLTAAPRHDGGLSLMLRDGLRLTSYDSTGTAVTATYAPASGGAGLPPGAARSDANGAPIVNWLGGQPYLFDQWGQRLYHLLPSGSVRTEAIPKIFAQGSSQFAAPVALVSDSLLIATNAISPLLSTTPDYRVRLLVVGRDGIVRNGIAGPRLGQTMIVLQVGDRQITASSPSYSQRFGSHDMWSYSGGARRLTIVRRDSVLIDGTGIADIVQYGLDGSMHYRSSVRLELDSVDVVVRDSLRQSIVTSLQSQHRTLGLSPDSILRFVPRPDALLPIRAVHAADDGAVWLDVRRQKDSTERWVVLDPNGRLRGLVQLQAGQSFLAATRTHAWFLDRSGGRARALRVRLVPSDASTSHCGMPDQPKTPKGGTRSRESGARRG